MRPPESYLHGLAGPVVVVPARVATWLLRRAGLADYHREHRGVDPEVDAVLVALRVADQAWRASVGTDPGTDTDGAGLGPAGWLSTAQAGRRLGITDRAVRKAIASGRLPAQWIGGVHALDPEDLEHYRARRAPA